MTARGQATLVKENLMYSFLRAFNMTAEQQKEVKHSHIYSHEEHPWNELADAVAKETNQTETFQVRAPPIITKDLFSDAVNFTWWPTLLQNQQLANTMPTIKHEHQQDFLSAVITPTDHFQIPPHLNNQNHLSQPYNNDSTTFTTTIQLKIATLNILTLYPRKCTSSSSSTFSSGLIHPGKSTVLQQQFEQQHYNIVGMQETRSKSNETRHSNTHYIYAAAASQGKGGIELWLAKQLPIASIEGKPIFLNHEQITIMHADHRCLAAAISNPHFRFNVIVAHALDNTYPQQDRIQWWKTLESIQLLLPQQVPTILCIDANARVGQYTSDHIGNHVPDIECENGSHLHNFLSRSNLYLPSTFPEQHHGPTYTWQSPHQSQHRIDYVGLPLEWYNNSVISSYIEDAVDTMNFGEDHETAAVSVYLAFNRLTNRKQ